MCGICGVVGGEARGDGALASARVGAMVHALGHRGPDAAGLVETDLGAIGATRLAIRGLHDGAQPIVDRETGVVVACNGEIDNHRELRVWLEARGRRTPAATDVGVIPGLYLELGDAFVERLVGAFAIALWDPRRARLVLARDRAGERPVFFAQRGREVAFATELSAFVAERGRDAGLDRAALAAYLRFGTFVAPETPFADVRKVAPGEIVVFEGGELRRRRYWRWPVGEATVSEPSPDELDRRLRQAVLRQTDVDVPYAVFLSGGIDSSLVAALARRVRPDRTLTAFTLRFAEPSYDEGLVAERVARTLGLEHVPVWVRPDDVPGQLADLVGLVGEPLADPAWVPTALLARRAARDFKVALVGEGADELFGGYPTYIGARFAPLYARLPRVVRRLCASAVARLRPSDRKVPLAFLARRFVEGAHLAGPERHLLWTSVIAPEVLARLGMAGRVPVAEAPVADLLDWVQRWDLETSLAEGLLTKADRAGMSYALELRAPFLDQAVMEFAATLPAAARVRGVATKVFLKRFATRYLPPSVVHRRKRGLSVPLAAWLRGPLGAWAESRLGDPRLEAAGVGRGAALALLEEHRVGHHDHARALWALIVLSEWLGWLESASARPGAGPRREAPAHVRGPSGRSSRSACGPPAAGGRRREPA